MENETINGPKQMGVTCSMKENLMMGTKWVYFIAVLSVIGIVLMALSGLCLLFASVVSPLYPVLGVIYLVVAGCYYPIVKNVFAFVKNTQEACRVDDEASLEKGVEAFGKAAKYYGIFTIGVIVLYIFICIAAVISAIAMPQLFYSMQ